MENIFIGWPSKNGNVRVAIYYSYAFSSFCDIYYCAFEHASLGEVHRLGYGTM